MPSMNHSGSACSPGRSAGRAVGLRGHVVLERVDELVAEHVIGLGEAAGKRQDHAAAIALRHAAGAFADLAEDVGLLKVRMRRVEDERLPAAQLVLQQPGQPRVPPLGHSRGKPHRGFFFRVVVDVEVLGREHLEVEALVLDLVPAEILRARRNGGAHQ